MRRPKVAVVAVTVAALVGGVTACGTDDGGAPAPLAEQTATASPSTGPTPSPSPTLSDEEQAEQEIVAGAEEALAEYRQLEFDVAHGGFGGWASLAPFWGSEVAENQAGFYRGFSERGRYSTGVAELVSSEVTEYEGEYPGYEDVEFTLCLDSSELRLFEEDGTQVSLTTPDQYVWIYRMAHTGPDGRWQVSELSSFPDKEC